MSTPSTRSTPPTFSVVIPTLGRVRQLQGCLGRLAQLDYPAERFEVIVVNDGGGRAVEEAASGWEDRLELTLVSTAAAGVSAARNAGAERARGAFIAFTDDDCEPASGWLQALEPALQDAPGCAVGGRVLNGARGRCAAASQAVLDATHAHFNRGPDGPTFFATSNLVFPADSFRAIGGFDESFDHAEDRELCARWLRSGRRFGYAPDAIVWHMRESTPLGLWRQHFGYGRGAWHFHQVRREQYRRRFTVEPGFYAELASQVRTPRDGAGPLVLGGLALTSQFANAAGFAREAVARRLPSRRPGSNP